MIILATLTEVRKDYMQKWERLDLPKSDHMRYIWINPYQSVRGAKVGDEARILFDKGSGGAIGGHWSVYRVVEIVGK